uniref:Uncharacterized protein n=1 Tax=Kwoniella dejecticola CBS 10117 TaxID=1296121 RepID=A0A1A6A0F4_9TREE|nr:uncharacterized protein I303_05825 [Kwoniella dejecticola CBS 10117]OBR83545.1 hypothetical protein I303_05825 [Kwoniella dejecticola CBS 10117]
MNWVVDTAPEISTEETVRADGPGNDIKYEEDGGADMPKPAFTDGDANIGAEARTQGNTVRIMQQGSPELPRLTQADKGKGKRPREDDEDDEGEGDRDLPTPNTHLNPQLYSMFEGFSKEFLSEKWEKQQQEISNYRISLQHKDQVITALKEEVRRLKTKDQRRNDAEECLLAELNWLKARAVDGCRFLVQGKPDAASSSPSPSFSSAFTESRKARSNGSAPQILRESFPTDNPAPPRRSNATQTQTQHASSSRQPASPGLFSHPDKSTSEIRGRRPSSSARVRSIRSYGGMSDVRVSARLRSKSDWAPKTFDEIKSQAARDAYNFVVEGLTEESWSLEKIRKLTTSTEFNQHTTKSGSSSFGRWFGITHIWEREMEKANPDPELVYFLYSQEDSKSRSLVRSQRLADYEVA